MVHRAVNARTWIKHILLILSGWILAGNSAMADSYWVEVEGGETGFYVDLKKPEIRWVVGDCYKAIPAKKSSKNTEKPSISSERVIENVRLGQHRFELEQEFKFDMVDPRPSLQIYNSVRGAWSTVPVSVTPACGTDALCRKRAELPRCVN